jgi:hypothetical protein
MEMADSLVPDEDIMYRAPERRCIMQLDNKESSRLYKKPNPQWCPYGLTKSRRRRVQHLRQLEQQQQEERHMFYKKRVWPKVWRPKPKANDGKDDKPKADIT